MRRKVCLIGVAMSEIAFLADRPEAVATLAVWFRGQWPEYYAGRTPGEIEQDFRGEMNRRSLPVRLVAFEGLAPVGTVVLRERAIDTHPQYAPGLGGLYVDGPCRGRGVGTELVRAAMATARAMNHRNLYAATAPAGPMLMRLGWRQVETVLHRGERLAICHWAGD